MNKRSIPEMLIAAILASIVVFVVADLAGGIGDFPNERWAAAIAAICLAVWIGPGAFARYAGRGGDALRHIAIWLALAVGLALLFVYGQDTLASLGVNV
ncbi:hypothetical protein ACFSCV_03510 [Methylopila henanensis]|uniref:Uncharacterized protein n=1 Tax=Methylopila henanensis TaxID=873516 RepID=A0ABW4K334_9HYPH